MAGLEGDVKDLVEKLIDLKGRSSNKDLRLALKWDEERYFLVRNQARAEGLVTLQRGRGGFVLVTDSARSALTSDVDLPPEEKAKAAEDFAKEAEYYDAIATTLRREWVREEGYDDWVVEVTASKRVKGSGRWSVPDIVLASKIVRQYVPGFEFAVNSFEIKRFEALNALGVFEALNHKRSAHYSYLVVVNYPKKPDETANKLISDIAELCEEHQVGLILVCKGSEGDYESWNFYVIISERTDPNPDSLDSFIKQFLSADSKDAVAKMVR